MINVDEFVKEYVTRRKESLFLPDIRNYDAQLRRAISGKSFLVIGGAGSIGSSFVKAVLPYQPSALVVVDLNENALAELTRDLRSGGQYIPEDYITYPMDYASGTFAKMYRSRQGFDFVANFSAHKHVRSEKDIYSVETLLNNNVIHAGELLKVLEEYPPQAYFCVSTDKAANPVNIMGASKRIMEDVIFSYSDRFPVKTARFANVAFSNGSLPAGFLERLNKLQPLSAPSDVKRYFVSLQESGQICMLACVLGNNREIFFPKLRESQMMSFDRIAEQLLKTQGYEINYCESDAQAIREAEGLRSGSKKYPVHFSVSDTSGEKSYEEFYVDGEEIDTDRFQALGVITGKAMVNREKVEELIGRLSALFSMDNSMDKVGKEDIVQALEEYLPEFKHIEKGKSLDSKM